MKTRKMIFAVSGIFLSGLIGGNAFLHRTEPEYICFSNPYVQEEGCLRTSRVCREAVSSPKEVKPIAVCRASTYVNVRQQPSTAGAIVGKMYDHAVADIVASVNGEGGLWYQIQSGTVNGYVKASYFLTGAQAEAAAKEVGICYAEVNTAALRLRAEPNVSSQVLTTLRQGSEYLMLGEQNHFAKLAVDDTLTGYVSMDYIKTRMVFPQAVSLAEEAARQEEAVRRKQEAEAAIRKLEEVKLVEAKNDFTGIFPAQTSPVQQTVSAADRIAGTIAPNPLGQGDNPQVAAPQTAAPGSVPGTAYGPGGSGSEALVSAVRTALVAYAKQFLGNPYLYGGDSLTNGADCSGFVMRVFEHFGIDTGRSSRDQAAKGRQIAISAVLPGDLLFYASGDTINHVAIYIGGGQVIHAASASTGITVSPSDYRTACCAVSFLD